MQDQVNSKYPTQPIAVLSAAIATAGRVELGDSRAEFAARAGVSPKLVAAIENEKRPAWDIPAPEIFQITGAFLPATADLFWGASLVDLLIAEVTSGDYESAASTAAPLFDDPADANDARQLLRIAIHGGNIGYLGDCPARTLDESQRAQLLRRALDLAASGTDSAWIGATITEAFNQPTGMEPAR